MYCIMKKESIKTLNMSPTFGSNGNLTSQQGDVVICFICDEIVKGKGLPLLMTYTPYSNTDLPTKIGQLMGDDFMVIVAVTDVLCKRCLSLIYQLDKLENDSTKVRMMLIESLKLKYKLGGAEKECDILEVSSQSFEDNFYNENIEEHLDEETNVKKVSEDHSSANLKYSFISESIKTENLKLEDPGNITDIKVVNVANTSTSNEQYEECGTSFLRQVDSDQSELEKNNEFRGNSSESGETTHKCSACPFSSEVLDTLKNHLKTHSQHKIYKCLECCQKFETKQDADNHVDQLHKHPVIIFENNGEIIHNPYYCPSQNKLYECKICKFSHSDKKTYESHILKHSKSNRFCCLVCSKSFKNRIALKKHMFIHKVFKCSVCAAKFKNEVNLNYHSKTHHFKRKIGSSGDRKFLISTDNVINNGNIKREIVKIPHEGNTKVSPNKDDVETLLEKMYSDESKLDPKSKEMGWQETCEEEFITNLFNGKEVSGLKNHSVLKNTSTINNLSRRKPFEEDSNNSCLSKSNKNVNAFENGHKPELIHLQEQHINFDCLTVQSKITEEVKKSTKTNEGIESKASNAVEDLGQVDTNKVTPSKVYVCSLCGLKTSSETHIKRHFKSHIALERKTYKCNICDRVLTTQSNLKRHISLHESCASGEIECNMCNEVLTDRLHLKHHTETMHPESYQCSFCDRRFDSKKACREHEVTHPSLQCDKCQKMFLTEGRLKSHKVFVHREMIPQSCESKNDNFKCHICHRILTTYHNLKRHLRNHDKCSGVVSCTICNEQLADKLHLRQHVENKHPENHQCSFCHKVFGNRKSCKIHEMSHPERFVFKCESCEKLFLTEARLKRHREVMHRDLHCRYCGKEIGDPLKLLHHERRHERHKVLIPCDQCPKVFRTRSGLKYHMSVHTGKYKVYCEMCGKGFHSEVVLEEHKATHTKEVRYTCEKCGRTFSSNSTYRMHRLWHDNPLPYKCNICDRKFKHTSILSVHKRRAHTGERPYKCPHCSLTFCVSSTLNKHIVLHTKEYPHRCNQCDKGFTTRTKLAGHLAKIHDDYEMLNSKSTVCQYKMALHPSEVQGNQMEEHAQEPIIEVITQEDDSQTASLPVLEHVAVDAAQAAIFSIFQQDLPSSQFTLSEFDAEDK